MTTDSTANPTSSRSRIWLLVLDCREGPSRVLGAYASNELAIQFGHSQASRLGLTWRGCPGPHVMWDDECDLELRVEPHEIVSWAPLVASHAIQPPLPLSSPSA